MVIDQDIDTGDSTGRFLFNMHGAIARQKGQKTVFTLYVLKNAGRACNVV